MGVNGKAEKKGFRLDGRTPRIYLAGETGFEPIFTESESVVLPLNDSPARDVIPAARSVPCDGNLADFV